MNSKVFLICIISFVVFSCKNEEEKTVFYGKLPDVVNEEITLIPIDKYFPGLEEDKNLIKTTTDSLGQFKFSFNLKEKAFFQVTSNNYHCLKYDILIEPRDSIFIEQSAWSEKPYFNIGGSTKNKYAYLIDDYKIFPKDNVFYEKIKSNSFNTVTDFKNFIDSIYNKRINSIESKNIRKDEKLYFINSIKAERAKFLLDHLERRNYYISGEFKYFYPDNEYYNFLDSISFNASFCKTTAAKEMAYSYLTNKARIDFSGKQEEVWWKDNFKWKLNYIKSISKSEWKDLLLLSTINDYSMGLMDDDFFENIIPFEKEMANSFSDKFNSDLFRVNIRPYLNLAPGEICPDFELPDRNGKNHKLSDYKGNIVYIDFWGTWCSPCIEEIPDALLLQDKYKGKPVVFIYVALEYDLNNINYWKSVINGDEKRFDKFLNGKSFPGIHLVAEKQFRNEFIAPYKINFAPTHVLVDKNGKIVASRAKNAKEVSNDIDKLLRY